jgi:pimeloyl-ACP methyl ester carboxylesterase
MPLWQSLFYVLGTEPAVAVEVPKGTPPGRYQGTLTLSAGSREYDIPLTVTVGRGAADGVLLIDGALNQTDYTDLRRALREAGYPSNRVVEWRNLRAGLNSTATENATALLAALRRLGWRPEDRVDVVAHSFGGLVARRMAQINAQPGRQVVTLRNIITCGTPLGGHNGADAGAWAKLSVGKLRLLGEQLKTLRELGADHLRPSDFADVTVKSPEGYPRYWLLGGTDPSRMILPWSQVPVDLGEFEPLPHDSVVSTRSVAGYTPRRQWVNRALRPSLEPVVRQRCDQDTDSPRAIRFLCLRHEELVMDLRERRYPWRNPVRDLIVPLLLGSDWRPCGEPVSLTGPASLPYNQSGSDARSPARPSGTPGILDRAAAAAKSRLRSVTRSLAESGRRRLLPLASGAIRALGLGGAPGVHAR